MRTSGLNFRRTAVIAVCGTLIAVLSGCAPWPGFATGGMAERYETAWPEGRRMEQRYLDLLRAGANDFAAGRMDEARILMTRALREYDGGLQGEAELSRERAERILATVENDMHAGRRRGRQRAGS